MSAVNALVTCGISARYRAGDKEIYVSHILALSLSVCVSGRACDRTCNSSSCPEGNENERVTVNEMSM